MNIGIFTDTYFPEVNGVATSTKNLRDILVKNGHRVIVICTNGENNEVVFDDDVLRIPGIELKAIYGYRLAWIYNSKAMRIIRRLNLDLVHCNTEFGIGQFGFTVAKALSLPIVYTYHSMYEDYAYYITKGHFDQLVRKFLRTFSRVLVESKATELIIPSNKTKDYFREIGIDNYINVIPTGIDFSLFRKENVDMDRVARERKRLGIKDDEFVLLSLGRIANEKSVDVCIRGYKKFLLKYPEAKIKFVVVGDGPAYGSIVALSEELELKDRIVFVGKVLNVDVPIYYHLGDTFISASISETQGLTYMEAIAAGVPVLARFDANLLGVINDGETGYFFTDEDDLVSKIDFVTHLKNEEKKRIITNAQKNIDEFSIDTFYENVIKVYERAIKKNW